MHLAVVTAQTNPKLRRIRIVRHRHIDLYVIRSRPPLELRFRFDHIFDTRALMMLDDSLRPDKRLHLRVETVRHEFELAVWRDERDGPIVFEAR